MKQPKLILLGGANGSGKTTLARELVAVESLRYLGADEIAYELNPVSPSSVAIAAARQFSQRLEAAIADHESLIVEATLSGKSLLNPLAQARQQGYEINVAFVFLDSPEVCLARIAARVARGGHDVPEEDVRRRFTRANQNFWRLYRQAADRWFLYYNATDLYEAIAIGDQAGEAIFNEDRFTQWLTILNQ